MVYFSPRYAVFEYTLLQAFWVTAEVSESPIKSMFYVYFSSAVKTETQF